MPTGDYSNTQRIKRLREIKSLSTASEKSRGARDNTMQLAIRLGGILQKKENASSGAISYTCGNDINNGLTCTF
jgi:hypothetical protein